MENLAFLIMGSIITLSGWWAKWFFTKQDRYDNFRLAMVEKRLETHQKAFNLTYEIQKGASPEKYEIIFNRCHQWWSEHNFFLEPKSRKVFKDCYWELLIFRQKTTEPSMVQRQQNFLKIQINQTRKVLTEEIGFNWEQEKSPPDFNPITQANKSS
jgi:hypothetical protein